MTLKLFRFGGASVLAAAAACAAVVRTGGATPPPAAGGVAVVELFTSQGCSSCPPAERVLSDLNAARDGRPVFTLAFHVDYWDHLGWRDRFDSPAYSARQRHYADTLHLDQVYTPQMVVNGRAEFVGSDKDRADRAIADALATPAAVPVTATAAADGGGWRVRYAAPAAAAGETVNVAVVEQGLSTAVAAGENGGQTLDQPSVVQWFKAVPASAAGDVAVPPLPGVAAAHSRAVVFVQRSADGAVLGAVAAPLR